MMVLHAAAVGGSLELWAEASIDGTMRKPRKTDNGRHPGAATAQEIMDALGLHGTKKGRPHPSYAGAWLPSRGGIPVPSDGAAVQPGTGRISLARWAVETVQIPWSDIMRLLSKVAHNRSTVTGMTVGADLAYWADILRFAGSLVARQRFLPDLAPHHDHHKAVWRPVFTGRDYERLTALAGLMPGAARALGRESGARPMDAPVEVLGRVVGTMVDGMVSASAATPAEPKGKRGFDSIHDEWLHGLRTQDGAIWASEEADALITSIIEWRQAMTTLADPLLKFCLRLEEPEDGARGSRPWFVRYMVQSRTDPSLIVPADKIWKKKTGITGLYKDVDVAREFLLKSMGQLAEIVTGASGGQKGVAGGYWTDTAGAYRFLREEAPILEQLGYGVMLPSWWVGGRPKARISARAGTKPKMQAKGMLNMKSIVRFDWELAVGDQGITLRELRSLARTKAPLVNVRGQWIDTGSGEIRRAIEFIAGNKTATVRDAVMMGIGAGPAPEGMDLEVDSEDGRISGILDRLRGNMSMEELPQPSGFEGALRPYQIRGYSWLSFLHGIGMGGCLADDMGLGKTIQVLALIQQYRSDGGRAPVLLVCPTSVMDNWNKEAARFTPGLSVMIHHGTRRRKGDAFAREVKKHDMIVSSYGLVQRDIESVRKVRWGGVVLDEAQNIKNSDTKQARAVKTLNAGFRFALTGTPVENSVGDIWSIMEFLNPGLLGTQAEFKRGFFIPIQVRRDEEAANALKRMVTPFMLRRLKTDRSVISDLPEKMESNVYCSLTREQASLYAAVLTDLDDKMRQVGGIERKGLILATLAKLKQVCNHPAHLLKDGSAIPDRSGKLARLTEMLEEVAESGEQALVFTQFVEMGEILQRHIRETSGREALFLHGSVPRRQRSAMVERFQKGGTPVFIVSLKAGGTGLNLTAASHVFHFDRWWNPAVENQATDRAFRIGQKRNVQVYKMICSGTMEEKIDEIIRRKQEISEEVVGSGEGWLTKLSDTDIRKVLSLSKEAVRI